jgi:hypothetical protein
MSTTNESPQDRAAVNRALATAKAYRAQAQSLSAISMHNEQQQAAPATANEPRSPYDATEDGFVFANEEIETHIRREEHRTAARKAELRRSAPADGRA